MAKETEKTLSTSQLGIGSVAQSTNYVFSVVKNLENTHFDMLQPAATAILTEVSSLINNQVDYDVAGDPRQSSLVKASTQLCQVTE